MEITGKKIFITGGAGFIGSHAARALSGNNSVRVFDNLSTGSYDAIRDLAESGAIEFVRGDISDEKEIEAACEGAELFLHLAVMNLRQCMATPYGAVETNATGTLNVCRAAIAARVKRFVYVSTSDVYGDVSQFPTPETCSPAPATLYGVTKLAGEYITQTYAASDGLETVIVRPFNTYGPGEHIAGCSGEVLPRFILYALSGLPLPVYGSGEQTRSYTYIDDTVRGILLAAAAPEPPALPVNIASSQEVSVLEAADLVLKATGSSSGLKFLPPRPGDARRQLADTTSARELFGFTAEIPLQAGLPRLVEWIRSQGVSPDDAPVAWPGL